MEKMKKATRLKNPPQSKLNSGEFFSRFLDRIELAQYLRISIHAVDA
jgi:hypothetical protein